MAKASASTSYVDPGVAPYESALKAFYGGKYDKAEKLFEQAGEATEQTDLAARARTFQLACRQRLEDAPAPDDPFLEAVIAKNSGDFDTAMELCTRGGRRGKDERFAYLAASVAAVRGDSDDAITLLQQAIEMNDENRIHAYHDPDFDGLREDETFEQLIVREEAS